MKTSIIGQPDANLGGILAGLLASQSPFYDKIWLVSAFARKNAIRRISPHIRRAMARNADVRIVVGIDHKSTTVEALMAIAYLGVNASIVHNNNERHTFHAKLYLFEASGIAADLFVGSNNLTDGGLYSNTEVAIRTKFDLPADEDEYVAVKQSLQRYLFPTGPTVQPVSKALIQRLTERGDVLHERELRELRRGLKQTDNERERSAHRSLFGSEAVPRAPKLRQSGGAAKPPKATRSIGAYPPAELEKLRQVFTCASHKLRDLATGSNTYDMEDVSLTDLIVACAQEVVRLTEAGVLLAKRCPNFSHLRRIAGIKGKRLAGLRRKEQSPPALNVPWGSGQRFIQVVHRVRVNEGSTDPACRKLMGSPLEHYVDVAFEHLRANGLPPY